MSLRCGQAATQVVALKRKLKVLTSERCSSNLIKKCEYGVALTKPSPAKPPCYFTVLSIPAKEQSGHSYCGSVESYFCVSVYFEGLQDVPSLTAVACGEDNHRRTRVTSCCISPSIT